MNTYKAVIEYLGTEFNGFQKQNTGVPTIQNTLENCLRKITGGEASTIGSGRTDTGVHARGQVIKISIEKDIPEEGLKKALNDLLPLSITIRELEKCSEDFHPIRDSLQKEYRYRFVFNQTLDPMLKQMVTNFYGEADVEKMKAGAKHFLGEHDFQNYQTVGTDVDSTVRTISCCEIRPLTLQSSAFGTELEVLELRVVGTGFLKQMVRLIMGTLLEYGKGKLSEQQIIDSLKGPKLKQHLGPVARPEGLILYQVDYPIH